MPTQKINFTKAAIEALPTPSRGSRVYYYDERTRALAVCVTGNGLRSFYVYRRVGGRPKQIYIGAFPEFTVEMARRKAEEINGQIAIGEDPTAKRKAAREEPTFGDLFQYYLENHAIPYKKSWKYDQQQFERYLGTFVDRKVSSISRDDVRALIRTVASRNGPVSANRLLALLKTVFNYAYKNGIVRAENPASAVPLFAERPRERRLHDDEMPAFLKAVAGEPNPDIRDYILLSLATGARKSNVLEMQWSDLNLERRVWRIPVTKNGSSQTVPLTSLAVEILEARNASKVSAYVFPGRGNRGHLVEPKRGWARILKEAGLNDLRLHDLRRTFASYLSDTGATSTLIGVLLNHRSPTATAIYTRPGIDPLRESMETAMNAMLGRSFDQSSTK